MNELNFTTETRRARRTHRGLRAIRILRAPCGALRVSVVSPTRPQIGVDNRNHPCLNRLTSHSTRNLPLTVKTFEPGGMKMKLETLRRAAPGLLLALCCLAAGCQPPATQNANSTPTPSAKPPGEKVAGTRGGSLTHRLSQPPQTFNYIMVADESSNIVAFFLLSSRLVEFDHDAQDYAPALAETLEAQRRLALGRSPFARRPEVLRRPAAHVRGRGLHPARALRPEGQLAPLPRRDDDRATSPSRLKSRTRAASRSPSRSRSSCPRTTCRTSACSRATRSNPSCKKARSTRPTASPPTRRRLSPAASSRSARASRASASCSRATRTTGSGTRPAPNCLTSTRSRSKSSPTRTTPSPGSRKGSVHIYDRLRPADFASLRDGSGPAAGLRPRPRPLRRRSLVQPQPGQARRRQALRRARQARVVRGRALPPRRLARRRPRQHRAQRLARSRHAAPRLRHAGQPRVGRRTICPGTKYDLSKARALLTEAGFTTRGTRTRRSCTTRRATGSSSPSSPRRGRRRVWTARSSCRRT